MEKYVDIQREEMEKCLQGISPNFVEVEWQEFAKKPTFEVVYGANFKKHEFVWLVVFSSIDKRDGWSRTKGKDAIRVAILDAKKRIFIGRQSHTKRTLGWHDRLKEKCIELGKSFPNYKCPKCVDGYLLERKGVNSWGGYARKDNWKPVNPYHFFGCSNYPNCLFTKNIDAQ